MPRNRALIAVPVVDPDLLARARARATARRDHDPLKVKATAPDPVVVGTVATIRLYDAIDSWGEFWGVSAKEFAQTLAALPADVTEIRLHLNSPGGDVFEGVAITNMLRGHAARVVVVVDGLAASIASVIAMAGDEIQMCPNTSFMVHDASGLCYGNAADMQSMRELLDHVSDNIAGAYSTRAGGAAEEWRAVMQAETWYSAEEAVAVGLADLVVEPAKATTATACADFDLSAFRYPGRQAAPSPAARARPRASGPSRGAPMSKRVSTGTRVAGAVPAHDSDVVARTWDVNRVTAGLPDDLRPSQLRSLYAWVDPDGDPESVESYAYAHHHGVDGPANLRACLVGIARLNGAAGGTEIPAEDREAVYDHLAGHVRDADRQPPELLREGDDPAGSHRFADEATRVLAEVSGLIEGASRVVALRADKGKSLSKVNAELLDWIGDELTRLKALCATPLPDDGPTQEEVHRTVLAGLARLNDLSGDVQ